MKPTFLVLTDLSAAAHRAARFAGLLAAAAQGRLVLLHLEPEPLFEPELNMVTVPEEYYTQTRLDTEAAMQALARQLPVPAAVAEGGGLLHNRLHEYIESLRPQLLVMALAPEQDVLDHLLANQALPMLRDAGLPLLLVPDGTVQDPSLPITVAVAADGEEFQLNPASLALEPVLNSWPASCFVVHVAPPGEPQPGVLTQAVASVRRSGLLATERCTTYEVRHPSRSEGILQAALDVQADVLVLMARPRTFVGSVFGLGVVAQVARRCPVPLLVLPTLSPPHPEDLEGPAAGPSQLFI